MSKKQQISQHVIQLPALVAARLLRAYHQRISPYMPAACRFYPTCSIYAAEVIQNFGLLRGGYYALLRVLKCQPFHPGGIDLPPSSVHPSEPK